MKRILTATFATLALLATSAMAMYTYDNDIFVLADGADPGLPDVIGETVLVEIEPIAEPTTVAVAVDAGPEGDMIMSPIDTATSLTALPITEGWDSLGTAVMTATAPTPLGVGGSQSLAWPYV
jgi:hypothetical protein